jgi:lipopolysaccharide/colanic/teichoic acid biosynthesis glycosyltransferase
MESPIQTRVEESFVQVANPLNGSRTMILYAGNNGGVERHFHTTDSVKVVRVENMVEAVSFLQTVRSPDAILCDADLYGGDSFGLHNYIRSNPVYNRVPFILLCREFRETLFQRAFREKIDDLFILPLPPVKCILGRIDFLRRSGVHNHPSADPEKHEESWRVPVSKRLFDLVAASLALVLLSPLLLLVILAIRLESKGKVYYTSRRVGQKPFNLYKLRSMRTGSDSEIHRLAGKNNKYSREKKHAEIDYSLPCPQRCSQNSEPDTCTPPLYLEDITICEYWYGAQRTLVNGEKPTFIKIDNDPRVTRVGSFIRKTSIDELPQLFNVIRGDMSLVGNRPLPLYEAEKLTTDAKSRRFLAPAGLTGLWQIESHSHTGSLSEEDRIRMDISYADLFINKKYSIWIDLKIIMRTIPVLYQKEHV